MSASGKATFNNDIVLGDTQKAVFGDSEDLQIFHDSANSYIRDSGTGDLVIEGENRVLLRSTTGTEKYIECNKDDGVELYHNDVLKAQTTASSWLIKAANDLRLESGTWTGETSGKIQRHSNHMYFQIPDAGTYIYRNQSGSEKLTIEASNGNLVSQGNITAFSDIRLKEDIKTIDNSLDKVSKLRGVEYTRKETKEREIGVIAQEVKEIIPELVDVKDNTDSLGKGMSDVHVMKYQNTVGLLIEAIKELKERNEKLELIVNRLITEVEEK